MTVTELLTEITSRVGEGYENYTERAKSCFIDALRMSLPDGLNDVNAPGLRFTSNYYPSVPTVRLPMATLLAAAGLTDGKILNLRYSTDARASLITELTGSDNNIAFTAIQPGEAGNIISIEYRDPEAINSPAAVTVDSDDEYVKIVLFLATDADGDIDMDAEAAIAAFNAYESVFYVTCALADGETGAGQLTEMAETPLTGGAGDGSIRTLERLTHSELLASKLRPAILGSPDTVSFYCLNGTGTGSQIELVNGATIGIGSHLE